MGDNKKILVTGAGGFIGSHLVERCVAENLEVKAFLRYNSTNNWGWLNHSPCKNEIEITTGDIRDFDSVKSACKGCCAIFHLAALIGIPYSYISPLAYIRTNIEGTYNVLQTARDLELEQVLITSTSETYGTAQHVPIDEKHPMVGQSPYSASKISADQLALSFYLSFGLPVKIVRPFNTYGPRQSARAIIPTIITQILAKENKIQLGNLHPTRDLTYVQDTVAGFLSIYRSKKLFGEITNIGMNEEISMLNLVKLIIELMDSPIDVKSDQQRVRPKKSEVERLKCDNTKIISSTDWRPKYNLKSGLYNTIEWLKENMNRYKNDIYNV